MLFLVFYSCKNDSDALVVELADKIVQPKHYIVTKADKPLNIDGIANEQDWNHSLYSDYFIDIEGVKEPKYDTRFKMLWDDTFIYVYAELEEPYIWGDLTERDAIIYHNNDFEVFIDPTGTGMNYGEVEINALGTVFDLLLNKPYKVGGKAIMHWNLNEMKSAVHIEGTVNDNSDVDSMWTVELAIPLVALLEPRTDKLIPPVEGEQWRMNFSRVAWEHYIIDGKYQRKRENGKLLPESNWVWSNQKVINMHEPEKWGYLQFTHQSSIEGIEFKEDEDLITKQIAFALFRETRFGSLKNLLENDPGFKKQVIAKFSESESINTAFHKTLMGFEYSLKSPTTGKSFAIDHEGILKLIKG
jgi:hypothetical protein